MTSRSRLPGWFLKVSRLQVCSNQANSKPAWHCPHVGTSLIISQNREVNSTISVCLLVVHLSTVYLCVPTYLPTYLPTSLPTNRPTYLIHLPKYVRPYIHMHTYIHTHTPPHSINLFGLSFGIHTADSRTCDSRRCSDTVRRMATTGSSVDNQPLFKLLECW